MKIKLIDYGCDSAEYPRRAHYNDAGADVFLQEKLILWPNETKKTGLGFGVEIPDGYVGFIFPRSSLSAQGITCELPPIDSGYRGEIHAVITNCTKTHQTLNKGDRVGQLVILPVCIADFVSDLGNERKQGAFGSTGS